MTTTIDPAPRTSDARFDVDRGRPGRTTLLALWVEAVAAFGLLIVLVPWVSNDLFNWVAFGSTAERFDPAAREYLRFTLAVGGALTVGLAAALWFLVRHPLRRGERWAWQAVVASVATWFVVDSAASIATGFPRNAALNVVIVLGAIPGVLAARPR